MRQTGFWERYEGFRKKFEEEEKKTGDIRNGRKIKCDRK